MDPNQPPQQQPSVQQPTVSPQVPQPVVQQQGNGKKKIIIIVVLIIIVFLILVLVAYFLLGKKGDLEVILPTPSPTKEVQSSFRKTIVLVKDEPQSIPETNLILEYSEGSQIEEGCYDCIATTVIKATNDEESQDLQYSCGGIAGECINDLVVFGYNIVIDREIDLNAIEVTIIKE